MEILFDPNITYLLLVSGLVLLALALLAPGTGLLEAGALFSMVLAGIGIYNLALNIWGLALLLAGLVSFLISLKKKPRWLYLLISGLCLIIGSIFLFRIGVDGNGVHPVLATVTSICATGILWWAGSKSIDAIQRQPDHSLERLIGMTGKAHSEIQTEGTVYVDGEEWSARSEQIIREGSLVRVIQREGLVLVVEADNTDALAADHS